MSLNVSDEEPLGFSLTTALARIFDNSIDNDVTFVIGDEAAEVKAHKLILRSRSPVFRVMFADSPTSESSTVTIPDTDKASFETFLRYLYTDDLKELHSIDEVNRMLYLVEKYMMPMMKPICVSFLKKLLDLDTAFQIFNICTLYSLQEFRDIVIKFMADRAYECCNLETFTQQDYVLIEKFTESPHLCIAETTLLDAVLRWATHECNRRNISSSSENIRNVLGKILSNIRYMSISEADLQKKSLFDGVLNEDEVKELTHLYNANAADTMSEIFEIRPRNGLSFEEIKRFNRSPTECEDKVHHAVNLTTSEDVWLFGVSVFGPRYAHDYVCVILEVKADGNHHSKVTRDLKSTDFKDKVANVMLKKPIRLKPKIQYTLLLSRFGSGTDQAFYKKYDLKTSIDFHGTTLSFSDTIDSKYDSYNGRGQFPGLFLQGMNESYAAKKYKRK